jgi:hypothetical protein
MKLYTDIDGVLLGKSNKTGWPILANHAQQYIEYSLANFDMYWLTTHCRGSADTALNYLSPYCTAEMLTLLEQIKATNFKTFKTEALSGDFIWVDDQPTAYEFMMLEQNGWLERWYQVNTRRNSNELLTLIESLKQLKPH